MNPTRYDCGVQLNALRALYRGCETNAEWELHKEMYLECWRQGNVTADWWRMFNQIRRRVH